MMGRTRNRMLPEGWYPRDEQKVRAVIEQWRGESDARARTAVACVVPHAGWDFSGSLAMATMEKLKKRVDTVAVIGGHLPERPIIRMAPEDRFETPLGEIEVDQELRQALATMLDPEMDTQADNTVEVQLPLVKYLYPGAQLLYLRVSPTPLSVKLGEVLYDLVSTSGKTLVVVGSTDLTHYGSAYGFSPFGRGDDAVRWVKEENDRGFLSLLAEVEPEKAIAHANSHGSACSAGGAAAAAAFARRCGVSKGELVGHHLSCELHAAESFVGYGGVSFSV